jgi:hypothetical protein
VGPLDFLAQLTEGLEDRIAMLQKQFPNFADRIPSFVEADPSGKGDFLTWICRMVRDGHLRFPEDVSKVKERLAQFTQLKRTPAFTGAKDINAYKSYGELAQTIDANMGVKSKGQQTRDAQMNGVEDLGTFGYFNVLRVTTPEAGAKLFRGTDWCVKDPEFFNQYGPPFYMFSLRSGDKFALLNLTNEFQFKDVFDDDIESDEPINKAFAEMIQAGVLPINNPDVVESMVCGGFITQRIPRLEPVVMERPVSIVYYAEHAIKGRWPEAEPALLQGYEGVVRYAALMIKGRWPELEQKIIASQDAAEAITYASWLLKGRWPEAEPFIAKDPKDAFIYARDTIKGRWPEAEPVIAEDPLWAAHYAEAIIKGPWPEGEYAISLDAYPALTYAQHCIMGRWPRGEWAILESVTQTLTYVERVIKGRWPEAEEMLKGSPHQWAWDKYLRILAGLGIKVPN